MTSLLLLAVLAQAPAAAPQLPRADVHFVAGWQNLHQPQELDHYNEWLNAILYGGAGAGWYWTDHIKTQVDIGAGTRATQYQVRQLVIDGIPTYASSRLNIRQQNVTIGQQYQFFRNQWFHPHVGAGVDLARETTTEEIQPFVTYDTLTRTPLTLPAARTEGPTDRFTARPFAEAGFKAYMTHRAFFTGDARVMFRNGIDEVLFRAGFGFDF